LAYVFHRSVVNTVASLHSNHHICSCYEANDIPVYTSEERTVDYMPCDACGEYDTKVLIIMS